MFTKWGIEMRRFTLLLLALSVSFVGCKPPAEEPLPKAAKPRSSAVTDDAAPAEGGAPSNPQSSTEGGAAVRFVASKKLSVPGMSCPYGCYPTVQKALSTIPGVEGVQLAEQPAGTPEGEIALRVVELKLGEGFDLNSALTALKQVNFEASETN